MGFPAALFMVSAVAAIAASPRETPTVKLIRGLEGAVLPIFVEGENGKFTGGTASVIHPDGILLSNDHVMMGRQGVALINRTRVPFTVIGRLPDKDIAILMLQGTDSIGVLPVGYSDDLMTGEPIVAAGNPGSRGLVYSQGIISAASIMRMNALFMSYFKSGRDEFIQFDAATNPGNSGGPLINMLGQQIGIVSAGVPGEENVNYAIPIGRVRSLFGNLLPVEVRFDFWTGLQVDFLARKCVLTTVLEDSPAQRAGLRKGDILKHVDGKAIRDGLDWPMSLLRRNQLDPIEVSYQRKGKQREALIEPVAYPLAPVVEKKRKKPGLKYSVYHGSYKVMPDFASLDAVHGGVSANLQTELLSPERNDRFALAFEGYLEVPHTGLFTFSLGSDDGSKLFLDGELIIDNDDNHPLQHLSRLTRLQAGLHRVRIEFFEFTGAAELELFVEATGIKKKLIPDSWFFHE